MYIYVMAKAPVSKMKNSLIIKKFSIAVRNRGLKNYKEPIQLYAHETLTMRRQAEKHL